MADGWTWWSGLMELVVGTAVDNLIELFGLSIEDVPGVTTDGLTVSEDANHYLAF